ncbi:YlzJ-like family protein [Alicyclobacillus sp. SO9]|uniref:YlzJ-like family protein n=1 Tax=Alicyclobacillus sp. SO9 TaxID=2665646 RepID=UPI0018E7C761|nr:YlzJ-like family protein [Alicyclobacillus sp. SO9]QQE80863.1 YlzJ-like family protein [Alicyclobacillus sp. SO9]
MTLFWSLRSFEQVMEGCDKDYELEELNVGSAIMLIENVGGQRRISRLISPDANDYLNPDWQPGTILGERAKNK